MDVICTRRDDAGVPSVSNFNVTGTGRVDRTRWTLFRALGYCGGALGWGMSTAVG
jgi:hypothetical protein